LKKDKVVEFFNMTDYRFFGIKNFQARNGI